MIDKNPDSKINNIASPHSATSKKNIIRSFFTWKAQPPSIVHLVYASAISFTIVYAKSLPDGLSNLVFGLLPINFCLSIPIALLLIWPGGALLILVDYLARVIVCLSRRTWSPRQWRWYVTPVCLLIVIHAWRTEWPLHWRWEHSRPAFEQAAQILIAGPSTVPVELQYPDFLYPYHTSYDRRLGSFRVRNVSVHPDEKLVFFMTGCFFRADWGFLYNPTNRKDSFVGEELSPGWYTYMYSRD